MGQREQIFLSFALAILLAAAGYLVWSDQRVVETKDRLTTAAMQRMAEEPMSVVRSHGLEAGRKNFGALLASYEGRYGVNSVEAADLATSFGVALFNDGKATNNQPEMATARDYLRDAIPMYRRAFGAHHPEVAVALNTFADADVKVNGGPTPQAKAALEEAVLIRRKTLGLENPETKAAEADLAYLQGNEL
jgi:hypothetical protein